MGLLKLTSPSSLPSNQISTSSPPSYAQTIASIEPLVLPKALLDAPRSSHYSHTASGPSSTLRRAHLFDLSRPVPLAALPEVTRDEEVSLDKTRVNGFFWARSEAGGVDLDLGAVGRLEEEMGREDEGEGSGSRRRKNRVRIVAGSDGEGTVTIRVVSR